MYLSLSSLSLSLAHSLTHSLSHSLSLSLSLSHSLSLSLTIPSLSLTPSISLLLSSIQNANETAIPLEHAITHNNSLKNAHSAIDQMADIASGSLQGLRNQYGILQVSNTLCILFVVVREGVVHECTRSSMDFVHLFEIIYEYWA